MHQCASVMLLISLGTAWAQVIPERNCMSNPFMAGCPAAEQAQKTQEMLSQPMMPPLGLNVSSQAAQTVNVAAATAGPRAGNDDWKRPRLAKELPADWPRWSFAEPDASALVGVKLRAMIASASLDAIVGADVMSRWRAAPPPVDELWMSIEAVPGKAPESLLLFTGTGLESVASDLRAKGMTVCFLDR